MSEQTYIHGTEPSEQARLALLNRLTNGPFVEFLQVRPGLRVLEVGLEVSGARRGLGCSRRKWQVRLTG